MIWSYFDSPSTLASSSGSSAAALPAAAGCCDSESWRTAPWRRLGAGELAAQAAHAPRHGRRGRAAGSPRTTRATLRGRLALFGRRRARRSEAVDLAAQSSKRPSRAAATTSSSSLGATSASINWGMTSRSPVCASAQAATPRTPTSLSESILRNRTLNGRRASGPSL